MTNSSFPPHPLIIAHRGASALAPENTMAAFRLAYELGADGIELDVMLSQDQKLVVHHDQSVNRTTNGHGKVFELKWDYLKTLDAGSKFGDQFVGEPLPLLENVFEELGGKFLINVELKNYATPNDDLTALVVDLIEKMNLADAVILSSFGGKNLLQARAKNPSIRRGLLAMPGLAGSPYRGFLGKRFDYTALHPYHGDVRPSLVRRMHQKGKDVNVWTVDKTEDLLRMRDCQVDMVICNDPKRARQVYEAG